MRLSSAVVAVIAPLALAACGESTGPETPFSISVSIVSSTGPTFVDSDTSAQLVCDVTLRAVAHGRGTGLWSAGEYYFFAGPDRVAPVDSGTISVMTVQQSWGSASIDSAHAQQGQWRVSALIPFDFALAFAYTQINGPKNRTEPVKFSCGGAIPPGSNPPTFTSVSASPATGEIEAGDTVTVAYAVTSSVGVWESAIVVTGACTSTRVVPEHLAHVTTRSVPIVIPPGCVLGGKLNVSIRAFDAAGRGIQSPVATLSVVDHTPPRVTMSFGFNGDTEPTGFYFGGDSIPAYLGASDNQGLSAVYRDIWPWGRRDSVRTSAANISQRFDIRISEDWSGGVQFKAFSRDAAGLLSDTVVTDSLFIYPSVARALQAKTLSVPINDFIFDERRNVIYVRSSFAACLLVLSTTDLSIVDSIALPEAAYDFDLTPGGDTLVMTLPGARALGILDLTASPRSVAVHPLTTLDVGKDQRPEIVRIPATGKVLVRLNGATYYQTTLLEVDLSSGVERVRTDAGVNGIVGYASMERSHDGRVIILRPDNQVQRYDASVDAFGPLTAAGEAIGYVRMDATGSHFALGLDVYDATTLQLERRVDSPAFDPYLPIALSPDGQVLAHYAIGRGIVRSNAVTGRVIDRTRIPGAAFLRYSPDGSLLAMLAFKTMYLLDLR